MITSSENERDLNTQFMEKLCFSKRDPPLESDRTTKKGSTEE